MTTGYASLPYLPSYWKLMMNSLRTATHGLLEQLSCFLSSTVMKWYETQDGREGATQRQGGGPVVKLLPHTHEEAT